MIFFQNRKTKDFEEQLNSRLVESKEEFKFSSKTPDTGSADAKKMSQTAKIG